eukprot:TRINITY_DN33609_c0_g1_i1.p1 TRINITY_DN33609_c0_g1~~TRINITY_DN33609_c0_g1_i1.p1  ORF type:complete len:598 (-),score=91.35 TRINITY_DN33609_c0_g1_i1:384-2177(-)
MITYDERGCLLKLLFKRKGSVFPRALIFAFPSALLAVVMTRIDDYFPNATKTSGTSDLTESMLWSATTASIGLLVSFRIKQALGRFWEGTGLLHQMRGEWFDSVDCLFTFSRQGKSQKPAEVVEFRHTLVRLMSLCHGSALEEIKASPQSNYDVIDLRGLDKQTRGYLQESKDVHHFNRVEVLLHMIRVLLTQAIDDTVVKVPPPIASRVYQTLSRGLVNLLNAKKITDTKFPFPLAQLITILLVLYSLFTPLLISVAVKNTYMAAFISFWPVFASFSLNFAAIELEMPFGDDDNDLPLSDFQAEMNTSLMMLLHDKADLMAGTSVQCDRDFQSLKCNIRCLEEMENGLIGAKPKKRKSMGPKESKDTCMFGFDVECAEVEDLPTCPPSSDGNASAGTNPTSETQSPRFGCSPPPLCDPTLDCLVVREDLSQLVVAPTNANASSTGGVAAAPAATAAAPAAAAPQEQLVDIKASGLETALNKSFNELSASLREWSRKSDALAEAMSRQFMRNTDVLASFSESVPMLADSIPKLVDTLSSFNFHYSQHRREQPLVEPKLHTNRMMDSCEQSSAWKTTSCCNGQREGRSPIQHSFANYR